VDEVRSHPTVHLCPIVLIPAHTTRAESRSEKGF
jgi:hypothetical protein